MRLFASRALPVSTRYCAEAAGAQAEIATAPTAVASAIPVFQFLFFMMMFPRPARAPLPRTPSSDCLRFYLSLDPRRGQKLPRFEARQRYWNCEMLRVRIERSRPIFRGSFHVKEQACAGGEDQRNQDDRDQQVLAPGGSRATAALFRSTAAGVAMFAD